MNKYILPELNLWVLDNFRLKENETPQVIIDLFIFITHLGDGVFLIGVALCSLAALLFKKVYDISALWAFTVTSSFLLSGSLKHLLGKPRPDEIYHLIHVASPAFPSGHALRSTVVYVAGAIVLFSVFKIRQGRNFILLGSFLLPFSIGLSRLLLGVHWFGDVLAGWLIGFTVCAAFYYISQRSLSPRITRAETSSR